MLVVSLLLGLATRNLRIFKSFKLDGFFVFIVALVVMWGYVELAGKHLCVVVGPKNARHYVLVKSTTYTYSNGSTVALDPATLPNSSIINNTNKTIYFDLIGYGNISIHYGHVDVAPMSIAATIRYPDYALKTAPQHLTEWTSSSQRNQTTPMGWLHLNRDDRTEGSGVVVFGTVWW